jgi:lactam utilization protein B
MRHDGTRGGLNTKVTAQVDSMDRALQLMVDSNNQADIRCVDRIEIPSGHRLVADKGYDSAASALATRSSPSTSSPSSNSPPSSIGSSRPFEDTP